MIIIGITGPTGAGKTTALAEIQRLGGAVIDCDRAYHELLESDITLQDELENTFGPLRGADGQIDRKKLGAIVFDDPAKLAQLDAIAQRATVERVREMVAEQERQGMSLVAIDAIALLESGLGELCDATVAVLAPPEVRVARIMAREGISREYAWARVGAQKPEGYFRRGCGHVLFNDCGSREEFARQARALFQEILSQRG